MRLPLLMFLTAFGLPGTEFITQRDAPATIYAMGDVHGDYERMIRLLRAGGVIDAGHKWIAGDAVLVVTGDMIDKGPRPVDVIRFLAALREAAPKSHGQVILLAGNHEAEFLAGPDRKKAADFLADLERHHMDANGVTSCRSDIGETLCSLPFAARVGEWFFSHGGNTAGRNMVKLETDLRAGFAAQGYNSPALLNPDSILEARLGAGNQWISAGGREQHKLLASYVVALGVKHIVQGHQPKAVTFDDGSERNAGEMFQYRGLLFLIDTGMSRGVGDSAGALLEIHHGEASAVCSSGARTSIWRESADAKVGRAGACAE